jgi:uncharacterized membrane protein YhaH (DUF805 family)
MRVMVAALGIIGLAAICAWLLAWNNCLNLLPGHSGFDYFCGHNALLQVVPLFFLLLVLLAFFSGIIVRRWKTRRSSGK